MIAVRKYSLFALASAAIFIGFYGGWPINLGTTGRWDVRCNLFPEASLEKEIAQCEDVLAEKIYEGEALGEVYFRLGYFHNQLGEWQIAYDYYQIARELRPLRVSAHHNTASILGRHKQDWEGVVEATTDTIDLIDPVLSHHSHAWTMRGIARMMLGQFDEALVDFKVAQSIYPEERWLAEVIEHFDHVKRVLIDNDFKIPDTPTTLDSTQMLQLLGRMFLNL